MDEPADVEGVGTTAGLEERAFQGQLQGSEIPFFTSIFLVMFPSELAEPESFELGQISFKCLSSSKHKDW